MRFSDLTAENEPDPRPSRLRREERHEEVAGIRQSRAFVLHPQLHRWRRRTGKALPTYGDPATGFLHGIDGVANQIDEQLFELIAVALDRQPRTRRHRD